MTRPAAAITAREACNCSTASKRPASSQLHLLYTAQVQSNQSNQRSDQSNQRQRSQKGPPWTAILYCCPHITSSDQSTQCQQYTGCSNSRHRQRIQSLDACRGNHAPCLIVYNPCNAWQHKAAGAAMQGHAKSASIACLKAGTPKQQHSPAHSRHTSTHTHSSRKTLLQRDTQCSTTWCSIAAHITAHSADASEIQAWPAATVPAQEAGTKHWHLCVYAAAASRQYTAAFSKQESPTNTKQIKARTAQHVTQKQSCTTALHCLKTLLPK